MVFPLDFFPFFKATFSAFTHLTSELKKLNKHEKIKCSDEILNGNDRSGLSEL